MFSSTRHLPTPFLLLDLAQVERNVAAVRDALPGVEVYYALKCNPDPRLVAVLHGLGVGFEVASGGELKQLLAAGVASRQIMCLHPIKSLDFLRLVRQAGVEVLAADCPEELEKIAQEVPGAQVAVRVAVPNDGSLVPLTGKFGCPPDQAAELLFRARLLGLRPAGLTTHVGSQCQSASTWAKAMAIYREVGWQAVAQGTPLELVSLGGGLGAPYRGGSVPLAEVGQVIRSFEPHRMAPAGCRVTVEPGRAIAASAGTLFTTVTATTTRPDGCWAYLDAGVYNGLFEALPANGGFAFPIEVEDSSRPAVTYHLAGPTCDSTDVPFRAVTLPRLRVGDRLAIRCAGAYSVALACPFNSFPIPPVLTTDEVPLRAKKRRRSA